MPATKEECVRLLANSHGVAPYYASQVVRRRVDPDTWRDLISNRSQVAPEDGVEYLLKELEEASNELV